MKQKYTLVVATLQLIDNRVVVDTSLFRVETADINKVIKAKKFGLVMAVFKGFPEMMGFVPDRKRCHVGSLVWDESAKNPMNQYYKPGTSTAQPGMSDMQWDGD